MPPANLMTQHIGGLYPLMQQQSLLQNALGNHLPHTNTLSGLLQQQNLLGTPMEVAISEQAIAMQQQADALREYRRKAHVDWAMGNACKAAKDGDKLIDRMAFWSAFGLLAVPIMNRLAKRLDRVSERVERHMASAA